MLKEFVKITVWVWIRRTICLGTVTPLFPRGRRLYVAVVVCVAAGSSQRVAAVGDEGAGGARHDPVTHSDHRAEATARHRPSGSPVLRLRPDPSRRLHLARDLRRSHHHLHRQSTLLSSISLHDTL